MSACVIEGFFSVQLCVTEIKGSRMLLGRLVRGILRATFYFFFLFLFTPENTYGARTTTATMTIISGPRGVVSRVERAPEREKDRAVSRNVFAVLIGSTFHEDRERPRARTRARSRDR